MEIWHENKSASSTSSLKFSLTEKVMLTIKRGDALKKLAWREIFMIYTLNTMGINRTDDYLNIKCLLIYVTVDNLGVCLEVNRNLIMTFLMDKRWPVALVY